jgi:hypothetical protein
MNRQFVIKMFPVGGGKLRAVLAERGSRAIEHQSIEAQLLGLVDAEHGATAAIAQH